MKLAPLTRNVEVRAELVKDRTLELTFSSEYPVDRWFGREVLVHGKENVRIDRLNDGAPLLFNHNMDDLRGVVEKAWIDKDKKGRALIRFSTDDDGEKALKQVNDRVLRNVSFMYRIHAWEMTETSDDNDDDREYRITDWEPLEISLVTIPADPTVGVGRSLVRGFSTEELEPQARPATRSNAMTTKQTPAAGSDPAGQQPPANPEVRIEPGQQQPPPQIDPLQFERERIEFIRDYVRQNNFDERYAQRWIQGAFSPLQVGKEGMAILRERSKDDTNSVGYLDLDRKDKRRYSLLRAIRCAINNDWKKDGGIELEANNELSKRLDRLPRSERSFFVPLDVMMRDLPRHQKRDMTVAGVSGSQFLVQTDNLPGSFIDLLRNTSVALRMGVDRLGGLKGNITIPKMTAGNSAFWLADETTQITESQPTIGQLSLAPKNVAALTEISHQLAVQSSPDAENLVLASIARDIGLAVDVGILRGSGASGQPTGIATTGGIGAFTGTSLAAAGVLNAQGDVAAANALYPGCGYATTPAVAELLMARPELPSTGTTRLWKGNMLQGSIFDFPAMSSAQMSSATMLFGWWPSVVLAEWGVLELMVNPFSDFTRGLTAVRGWYMCDVGVRYAGAWSLASSIT